MMSPPKSSSPPVLQVLQNARPPFQNKHTMMTMPLFRFPTMFLWRLSLLCYFVGFTFGAVDPETTASDASLRRGHEWIRACRQQGFDPAQLGCDTCRIVPSSVKDSCLACCQAYKDTPSLRTPYSSAVILVSAASSMESEVETFLRDDFESLRSAKGGAAKLEKMTIKSSNSNNNDGFWFMRTQPAELLFLDEPLKSGLSEKELRQKAKESIVLYGWKREDIKDMIETLLD